MGRTALLLFSFLIWASVPAILLAQSTPYELTFQVNGFDRRAKIYPPSNPSQASPVLFYFHGYSGTAEDSEQRRQFHVLWPEAVIVYAEGRFPYSASQDLAGWRIRFPYIRTHCGEDEDLVYIDRVLDDLEDRFEVDAGRIYASGHSSGAFFTLALMELRPDLFRGFAMLGAYSRYRVDTAGLQCSDTTWTSAPPLELPSNASSDTPRPVLYMFGALENFDYDGPNGRRSYSSSCNDDSDFRNTVDELLIRNRGAVPPCNRQRDDYIKKDTRQIFPPASALGAETQIWLYGGGHSWEDFPGNANQVAVDYFQSLRPSWEVNHMGSSSFGAWSLARDTQVSDLSETVFHDFNGDGRSDAFQRLRGGFWRISLNRPAGWGAWQDVGSDGSTTLAELRFADFNGDGRTDVFRRLSSGTWEVNYMGASTFGSWSTVGSAGSMPLRRMRFADFNGDGRADVLISGGSALGLGPWQITFMGQNGTFGPWQSVGSVVPTGFQRLRVADFNGDGRADLFRRRANGEWQLRIMGDQAFGPWTTVGSVADAELGEMRFADFNGDGKTDVYHRQSNGQWRIHYMEDGTFGSWTNVGSAGSTPLLKTRFADFNGDGRSDVMRALGH